MAGGDATRGEANIFFPPGFTDSKPNIICPSIFKKEVEEACLSDAYSPRFFILDESDPENPRPICLAGPHEETIFNLQIDAGLRFLYAQTWKKCASITVSPLPSFLPTLFVLG